MVRDQVLVAEFPWRTRYRSKGARRD